MEFGLERITTLLQHLGAPHERLRAIHVAGTNGKGSVCAFMAQTLIQAGYKVGTFNSPHLLSPNDTIRIQGTAIDKDTYERTMQKVVACDKEHAVGASSFERLVAAAYFTFDKHSLDFVVVEVGLGGLLDATNVLPAPVMTVITLLGLDHVAILGNTLTEIARAKAGIIKRNCPVVIAPQPDHAVVDVIRAIAREKNAPCVILPPNVAIKLDESMPAASDHVYAQYFRLQHMAKDATSNGNDAVIANFDLDYGVMLQGDYQGDNSATAMTALLWMRQRGVFEADDATLQQGMLRTRWPGRLDWVRLPKRLNLAFDTILVDGAHNDSACEALRAYVDQCLQRNTSVKRVIWLIGITQGKSFQGMLATLVRPGDTVLTVPFSQPEGMPWVQCIDPTELAQSARENNVHVDAHQTLNDALVRAGRDFDPIHDMVVMCGSLYLAADLYRLIDPDS
ncbi:Mur ligase [Gongronella butleri]|nr:Mur ligase [Gongronella butleri]